MTVKKLGSNQLNRTYICGDEQVARLVRSCELGDQDRHTIPSVTLGKQLKCSENYECGLVLGRQNISNNTTYGRGGWLSGLIKVMG
jgi:hypothetical protein